MSEMKPIDLENRVITFGSTQMEGFADGEVATVEWDGPGFSYKKGADGEAMRGKIYGRSGTMKVRLWQTSSANDKLSAQFNLDYKAKNGAGIAPLQLVDVLGTTLFHADQAYIEGIPNEPVSAEGGTREWSIKFHNAEAVLGGT